MRKPRARAGRRFTPLLIGLLLALAMLPAAAQATQVGTVTVEACSGEGGCVPTNQIRVDQQFGISLKFHVTNGLSPGNHIYIEGPEGFVFANDIHQIQIGYGGGGYSDGGHGTFNNGRSFGMEIASFGPIVPAGSELEVAVGFFENKLTTPPQPGEMHFKVWTSSDPDARESSNAITTTVGEPAALNLVTSSLAGTVVQAFAQQPEVELVDSRGNPLSGKTITFEAPGTEPSGTFTGPVTSSTGATGSGGIAAPSLSLHAGTVAGEWDIAVSGPNGTSTTIPVTNLAGGAQQVQISLQPSMLPADESSTSEATIGVTDGYGNKVTGDNIEIETAGGPSATTPALQGNGSFTSQLTASRVPGEYVITARDTTAGISGVATLTQAKLPAASLELTLKPATVIADPLEKAVAVATITDELGQPVSGEQVKFESPFTDGVQAPVDNGDGTYSWSVPVTAVSGQYKITAIDESVAPSISGSATLTETPKPVPPGQGQNNPPPATSPPPAVKIGKGPTGVIHRARVRFEFAAPGAASFQCRLDDGDWKRCGSSASFTVALGPHVFRVRALSAGGTPGPVAKRIFRRAGKHPRHRHAGGRRSP